MKSHKDLLKILSARSQDKIKNIPLNNKTNISSPSIRIRTQQSVSPSSKFIDKSTDLMTNVFTVIVQHNNHNTQLYVPISESTDQLLARVKNLHPETTQLVTVAKDLAVDYYLQLINRPLRIFKGRILTVSPYIAVPQHKPRVCIRDFILIRCIGVGGFSRVYLVKKKVNGKFYAMKLIEKETIMKQNILNIIENERNIMAVINHPFLTKMEYAFECPNYLVFVTEYCPGSDLLQLLSKASQFTEQQAKFYFVELCLGLLYLHQLDIVFRDIKPENILIDLDGHVRLADFGLAKPNLKTETFSFCGSPEYMAPEMLLNEGHNQQLDHYCLGVLLYEMVTGLPPFYSADMQKVYESIVSDEVTFPKHLTPEIKDFIGKLMRKDKDERLGYQGGLLEIMDHPWFADVDLLAYLSKKIKPPFTPDRLRMPNQKKKLHDGELDMIKKLMDKQSQKPIFSNFYYDQANELDVRLEQQKFYKFYLQITDQQQGKMNRRRKQRMVQKMKLF